MLLITVTLVLATLLFINSKTAPKSSFIMEGRKKLTVSGEVAAISNSSSLIYCVKDLLLEAQDENLRVKNINGNVAWSQKLPFKITEIADAGEYIVITDSGNNIYYYSLQGKLLWSYKAPYEIVDLFTEDNGSFLAEYKGMTGSHAEVFTQNGSKIGSILVEHAQILSFSVGVDAFSISVLDVSAESIKTKIITYSFKGDILWAQNFDNKIISKLNHCKNNTLLAVGENTVYTYANDGSLKEENRIDGDIINVAVSDYLVTIALQDKGKKYMVCYDENMREQSRMEIDRVPLGIYPLKNSFVLYYNDELLVLTSKGELTSRFESNSEISRVYMTADNKLYVVSSRKLQMLEYVK
jgi:hypothetical protein